MGVGDGLEDWNSESGEDDGDGKGREDEVEVKELVEQRMSGRINCGTVRS